jgi:hypothetical protein
VNHCTCSGVKATIFRGVSSAAKIDICDTAQIPMAREIDTT